MRFSKGWSPVHLDPRQTGHRRTGLTRAFSYRPATDLTFEGALSVQWAARTRIVTGLIENGLGPDIMYTADGMQSGDVISQISPDDPAGLNGIKGTAPSAQGTQTFTDAFAEFAPGVATIFSAHAYDCTIILAPAAESADSTEPAEIAASMVDVTQGGTRCEYLDGGDSFPCRHEIAGAWSPKTTPADTANEAVRILFEEPIGFPSSGT